jgi:hypothetical protein
MFFQTYLHTYLSMCACMDKSAYRYKPNMESSKHKCKLNFGRNEPSSARKCHVMFILACLYTFMRAQEQDKRMQVGAWPWDRVVPQSPQAREPQPPQGLIYGNTLVTQESQQGQGTRQTSDADKEIITRIMTVV